LDWTTPDEEFFRAVNDCVRTVGTYLYGRRMYESMLVWETAPIVGQPPWVADFIDIWRAADKVVFSRSLSSVSTARTTLEPTFDAESIRRMKASGPHDLTVGGAELAAQAFGAGLVDECHVFLWPVVLGGGKRAHSEHGRLSLELLDERRLRSGVVHLRYRTVSS
jgi:dihydrofolate reductase